MVQSERPVGRMRVRARSPVHGRRRARSSGARRCGGAPAVPRRGGFLGSTKQRVTDLTNTARDRYDRTVAERRASNGFVDFMFRFVERDREADGSVTASAL